MSVFLILPLFGNANSSREDSARKGSRALDITRIRVPKNVELLDWDFQGDTIVSKEWDNGSFAIHVFRIGDKTLLRDAHIEFAGGALPLFIGPEKIAYIAEGHSLIITTLDATKNIRSIPLKGLGTIGELTGSSVSLWLYSIGQHATPANARMYSVIADEPKVLDMGDGYYPRGNGANTLYFVDEARGYALCSVRIEGGRRASVSPALVFGGPVYFPQTVPGKKLLIIQHGFRFPRIELLNTHGKLLRCLSGEERSGVYPSVSPSGKYIAFTHLEHGDSRASVVEIVDMDGVLLYQGLVGSHPIMGAYRWALNLDRIAVVVHDGLMHSTLEVVSFP